MKHFKSDDAGYLKWITENPEGFVVNVERSPRPEYLILHRANCSTITKHRDDGAYTDRGYEKVVANDVNELRGFARRVGRADGSFSKHAAIASLREINARDFACSNYHLTIPNGQMAFALGPGRRHLKGCAARGGARVAYHAALAHQSPPERRAVKERPISRLL